MDATNNSRRKFLKKALAAGAGWYIVPRHVLGGRGFTAPSDKLVIGSVGIGGKGEVDVKRGAAIRSKFGSARYYKDYRQMLDKEHKQLDAISISTPDHMHAVI